MQRQHLTAVASPVADPIHVAVGGPKGACHSCTDQSCGIANRGPEFRLVSDFCPVPVPDNCSFSVPGVGTNTDAVPGSVSIASPCLDSDPATDSRRARAGHVLHVR